VASGELEPVQEASSATRETIPLVVEEPRKPVEPEPGSASTQGLGRTAPAVALSKGQSKVRELMSLLEPLELSDDQTARAEVILEDREKELRSWHEGIRNSRIFNPEEYGRSLQERRESWYRSLDALLDTKQHARLQQMMARNFLGQGTEFVVNHQEMTVIR
jgi:hypothetical protein